jgi:hypothetical protein
VVIDDYANRGYDFLMNSDHDQVTSPADLDDRGMVLISGNEITAKGPHIVHVGATQKVEPRSNRQAVLKEVARDQASFAIMAHPNWHPDFNHLPQAQLEKLRGYVGIEIYNGVIERLSGSPFATDRWDQLLGKGLRVWGFANDDSHAAHDVELGWNVVQASSRTPGGIIEAMRRGAFYASTGVELSTIEVRGNELIVAASEEVRWSVYREFQRRVHSHTGTQLVVEVPDDPKLRYLRVEAAGALGRVAWTQPFFAVSD